jgi:hypothetical protein
MLREPRSPETRSGDMCSSGVRPRRGRMRAFSLALVHAAILSCLACGGTQQSLTERLPSPLSQSKKSVLGTCRQLALRPTFISADTTQVVANGSVEIRQKRVKQPHLLRDPDKAERERRHKKEKDGGIEISIPGIFPEKDPELASYVDTLSYYEYSYEQAQYSIRLEPDPHSDPAGTLVSIKATTGSRSGDEALRDMANRILETVRRALDGSGAGVEPVAAPQAIPAAAVDSAQARPRPKAPHLTFPSVRK